MQFSFRRRYAPPPVAAIILSLVLPLALPLAAFAQDDGVTAAPDSGGGVARIDAIAGDVAIQRGDSDATLAAVPNAPVLGADYVTTGQTGRAEVGFDGRSAVRLGENVQIRFSKVDPADRQMQLAAGTIDLRLFGDTDGQSSIDTPSISIVPRTAGSFRVSVDSNGATAVTVRSGRADIVTPQGTQSLEPGTTLLADGPASNPNVQTEAAIAFDGFDSYNGERDHVYQLASADSQYVNTDIQGVGDLNDNGRWQDDGTYGPVWIPTTVAADWAPYRDGNWVWEDGFGWTWVASEPWGWAPYHYGRWYFSTAYHHWAWYPPAPARFAPAWSPALVGFVGFNIGAVSVGVGFGNIGWVPLAPFETFHPWWGPHASAFGNTTVVNNITVVNNTTVVNVHYRNLMVANAMTSVTRENFQAGRFAHPYVASQGEMRSLRTVAVQGALPIVPSQANLRFTERAAPPSLAVRPALMEHSFAGRATLAQRTPFTVQQASVSRVTHVAFRPEANGGGAPAFGRGKVSPGPAYARPIESNNAPGTPAFSRGASGAANGVNDPWSRFNSNRNVTRPNVNGAPAFARPAAPVTTFARPASPSFTQPQVRQGAPSYSRSAAAPSGVTPAYNRQATPAYNRAPAPAYNGQAAPAYNRQVAPAYNRQVAPAYNRQAAPAYNRQAAPAYNRQAPPAYNRQAAPAYNRQAAPAYNRQAAPASNRQAPPANRTKRPADNRSR